MDIRLLWSGFIIDFRRKQAIADGISEMLTLGALCAKC